MAPQETVREAQIKLARDFLGELREGRPLLRASFSLYEQHLHTIFDAGKEGTQLDGKQRGALDTAQRALNEAFGPDTAVLVYTSWTVQKGLYKRPDLSKKQDFVIQRRR